MVTSFLKGAFHDRPPLPCYTMTWNVHSVLDYLEGLGTNTSLSLEQLSHKLCMLLALTRPFQSVDQAALQVGRCSFRSEGVTILLATQAKLSRQGKALRKHFSHPSLTIENYVCPVTSLQKYIDVASSIRLEGKVKLFVAIVKPQNPVFSATVARWLKGILQSDWINIQFRDLWSSLNSRIYSYS